MIYTHAWEHNSIESGDANVFKTTWIKAEDIIPSEIIQIQKEKYCMFHFMSSLIVDRYSMHKSQLGTFRDGGG